MLIGLVALCLLGFSVSAVAFLVAVFRGGPLMPGVTAAGLSVLGIVVFSVLAGMTEDGERQPEPVEHRPEPSERRAGAAHDPGATSGEELPPLPDGFDYTVAVRDSTPGVALDLDIQIPGRLLRGQLEALSRQIAGQHEAHKTISINYRLPGTNEGGVAWATATLDPEPLVIILGTTVGENQEFEAALRAKAGRLEAPDPGQPREQAVSPAALPQGFSYEVTTHDLIPRLKLSLDVRISQRLTEPQLEALSRQIVERREEFERVFIGYYLPGMEFGAGGWALVTMDPDPRISIMGTTPHQHRELLQRQLPSGGRPIGVWMDQGTVGQRWTLLKRKNDFLMVMELPRGTGQAIRTPCRRRGKTSTGGRRYVPRKKSAHGEFFVIRKDGELETWDPQGRISTALRVEEPAATPPSPAPLAPGPREVAASIRAATASSATMVCDRFNVSSKLAKGRLRIRLDTDLPTSTVVTVSISRTYRARQLDVNDGSKRTDDFLVNLVDFKSTVGELAKGFVSGDLYGLEEAGVPAALDRHEKVKALGFNTTVLTVSHKIEARVLVPLQPDSRFGEMNVNLKGKKVRKAEFVDVNVVEWEKSYRRPMKPRLKRKLLGR